MEGIAGLNTRIHQDMGTELHVRLGIHTGIVVAGDMDTSEQLESMAIVGETPNLAARLQSLAEPDTVAISSATYQLIEGFFDCRSLGSRSLEGLSQPVEVFQVLHESGARTRLGRQSSIRFWLSSLRPSGKAVSHVVCQLPAWS